VVGIREALANLKKAIMSSPGEGAALADRETTDFLYNWLKNNKANYNSSAQVHELLVRLPISPESPSCQNHVFLLFTICDNCNILPTYYIPYYSHSTTFVSESSP
jgi:hypothetical protein